MGTRRLKSEGLVELDAFPLDPQSLNVARDHLREDRRQEGVAVLREVYPDPLEAAGTGVGREDPVRVEARVGADGGP